jgi:NADPH:quinone reductase-like Zn-dependent oxidoreductase
MLVHGGTSGIGTMAIKLGKLFGLTVIVTCGSAEKCAAALAIGADHAIDYKASDFVEEVAKITGGKGVHLVLDMVAGSYVPRNLKCLCEDGRHVTIAVQGGLVAEINMAQVMSRRLTLTGSTLRPRSERIQGAAGAGDLSQCLARRCRRAVAPRNGAVLSTGGSRRRASPDGKRRFCREDYPAGVRQQKTPEFPPGFDVSRYRLRSEPETYRNAVGARIQRVDICEQAR